MFKDLQLNVTKLQQQQDGETPSDGDITSQLINVKCGVVL